MTPGDFDEIMTAGISSKAGDDKKAERAFEILKKIKSLSFATINENRPAVRIIDLMDVKDNVPYFLTARGKPFYHQLKENPFVSITGLSKDYIMVRVEGEIAFAEDKSLLDELLEKNKSVSEVYNGKTDILEAFYIHSGCGEIFDLSSNVPKRIFFSFGGEVCDHKIYRITDDCTCCGVCIDACPVNAIREGGEDEPYIINPVLCLHCGRCSEVCLADAIVYSGEK